MYPKYLTLCSEKTKQKNKGLEVEQLLTDLTFLGKLSNLALPMVIQWWVHKLWQFYSTSLPITWNNINGSRFIISEDLFPVFIFSYILPYLFNLPFFLTSTNTDATTTKKTFLCPPVGNRWHTLYLNTNKLCCDILLSTYSFLRLTSQSSQQCFWNAACLCAGVWSLPQVGWKGAGRLLYSA